MRDTYTYESFDIFHKMNVTFILCSYISCWGKINKEDLSYFLELIMYIQTKSKIYNIIMTIPFGCLISSYRIIQKAILMILF